MDDPRGEFARLYDRLAPSLYRYALMLLANREEAEDAVHQVFAALMRRGVVDLNAVDHYLRASVRNACYTALRRRRNGHAAPEAFLEGVAASSANSPDERLMTEQALRDLPAEQREVVHLKVYEGWSFQEIAAMTDESLNTIASRYRYGAVTIDNEVTHEQWTSADPIPCSASDRLDLPRRKVGTTHRGYSPSR